MSKTSKGMNIAKALWSGLTFARQFTMNMIFVVFATVLVVAVLVSGDTKLFVPDKSTLVVDLEGSVVEQYTSTPMDRALKKLTGGKSQHETRLFDILLGLTAAKDDERIAQVWIKTDGLTNVGFAQAREIASAVRSVRASGKKVIAFGQSMDQKQYLIAAAADQVFLDPEGSVVLEGLGRYRQYYREALQDKLGVNVHLFRVGEFKSAAEPYVLDAASPQSKASDLYWMNDVWDRYVKDIAQQRTLNARVLQQNIAQLPDQVERHRGDLAKMALDQKLVDALNTEEQVERIMGKNGAYDSKKNMLVQIKLSDYTRDLGLQASSAPNKIAVVVAQGEIVDGTSGLESMGGENTSELLRTVRNDPEIKAVVLRVDSPGGSVFASEQIRREVEEIKKSGRPVVVSMGNTAASGGYWISMNADSIMADPSTITGSIGIFGLVPDFSKAMEKIGVHTDGVSTTPLAGSFNALRPLNKDMGRIIQSVINNGYEKFIGRVSQARQLAVEKVDGNARGRVWSGAQAKERGLVDELGGLNNAIVKAKELAHITTASKVVLVETGQTSMSKFLGGVNQGSWMQIFGDRLGVWEALTQVLPQSNQNDVKLLQSSLQSKAPIQAYAHCLCGL